MIVTLITKNRENVPPLYLKELEDAGIDIRCHKCANLDDLVKYAGEAEVIWIYGASCISAEALDHLPKLRAIFRSGSGMDAIPTARAKELGILCFNTPESISDAVAEHAASLILCCAHQLCQLNNEVHANFWEPSDKRMRYQVRRRTLGLVGYGLIGHALERMMAGFQMKVIHSDPVDPDAPTLEEVLKESDFVSLHCPLNDGTRHLMNREKFALMKKDAFLINTSRGGVVDSEALLEAVKNGVIAGAALDVTEVEPLPKDHFLLTDPRIVITPHLAAMSADFEKDFWSCSVKKLLFIREKLGM